MRRQTSYRRIAAELPPIGILATTRRGEVGEVIAHEDGQARLQFAGSVQGLYESDEITWQVTGGQTEGHWQTEGAELHVADRDYPELTDILGRPAPEIVRPGNEWGRVASKQVVARELRCTKCKEEVNASAAPGGRVAWGTCPKGGDHTPEWGPDKEASKTARNPFGLTQEFMCRRCTGGGWNGEYDRNGDQLPCKKCGGNGYTTDPSDIHTDPTDELYEEYPYRGQPKTSASMNPGVYTKLVMALTEYDRKQEGKVGYNHYALPQYLGAAQRAQELVEGGETLRNALITCFSGRLLSVALKAVGEPKGSDDEIKWGRTSAKTSFKPSADSSPPHTRIEAINAVMNHGVYGSDGKEVCIDGSILDIMTAGILKQVYEALNPANQAKFDSIPITKLVNFAWSKVKASKTADNSEWNTGAPNPNFPGETTLSCPKCGSTDVYSTGSNLGSDVVRGNNYAMNVCRNCDHRDSWSLPAPTGHGWGSQTGSKTAKPEHTDHICPGSGRVDDGDSRCPACGQYAPEGWHTKDGFVRQWHSWTPPKTAEGRPSIRAKHAEPAAYMSGRNKAADVASGLNARENESMAERHNGAFWTSTESRPRRASLAGQADKHAEVAREQDPGSAVSFPIGSHSFHPSEKTADSSNPNNTDGFTETTFDPYGAFSAAPGDCETCFGEGAFSDLRPDGKGFGPEHDCPDCGGTGKAS